MSLCRDKQPQGLLGSTTRIGCEEEDACQTFLFGGSSEKKMPSWRTLSWLPKYCVQYPPLIKWCPFNCLPLTYEAPWFAIYIFPEGLGLTSNNNLTKLNIWQQLHYKIISCWKNCLTIGLLKEGHFSSWHWWFKHNLLLGVDSLLCCRFCISLGLQHTLNIYQTQ